METYSTHNWKSSCCQGDRWRCW